MPRTQKLLDHYQTRGTIQKTQAHLKPYQPQDEDEDELCNQAKHKWAAHGAQNQLSDTNLVQSRPKRDIKPRNTLDL